MQSGPQPPEGHIGTPEAAEMVGVHQETIRNYIKDKKIEGMKEYDQATKRERYWAKRESVEALIQTQRPQDREAADQLARRTEDILERIAGQETGVHQRLLDLHQNLNTRLNRVEDRQIKVAENLEKAVDILEELGDRSKQFQDRMLEMLEEERDYLRKQREELGQGQDQEQSEQRGFWGWLFGQR